MGIPLKSIILCADDYSFSPGISEAIITLLNNHRLNATSCMVNTEYWHQQASALKPFSNKIHIGLHFTLTDIQPAITPLYTLSSIISKAYLRSIDQTDLENELLHQIERFEKALGQLPHFIDGHQHIHQLPIIRNALLSVYEKVFPKKTSYIRVPISKPRTIKSSVITLTGALALKKQLIERNIPYNNSFSGVYNFSTKKSYADYFRQFIKDIESNGIIMCHPSISAQKDRIATARHQEFCYFNSQQFLDDCKKYSVRVEHKQSVL